jgi:hypothetical protein
MSEVPDKTDLSRCGTDAQATIGVIRHQALAKRRSSIQMIQSEAAVGRLVFLEGCL